MIEEEKPTAESIFVMQMVVDQGMIWIDKMIDQFLGWLDRKGN